MLAVAATAVSVPSQVAVAEDLPKSPRAYLAPGESLADAYYNLTFGQYGVGTDSLAGTGMQDRRRRSLRLFHGPKGGDHTTITPQKPGMYHIAYKGTCCGEQVTKHLPNGIAYAGIYQYDYSYFHGTALWLGPSRFRSGAAPPLGLDSPPAEGTRADGTTGPADRAAAVRADDAHLISIPVVPNAETKRSFLISAYVLAPRHPGVRYQLRPQPYLDRGGLGLTAPAGTGHRAVDLGPVVDRFATLQIRADIVTHGGTRADTSDDTGKVTYRYFVENVEVGTADTIDMLASSLRTGRGDVRFGPAFELLHGWQGDAPEVFIDGIAVYDIQNMPFRTSWIGETILPQDAAKYSPDRNPVYERHVGNMVRAIWADPVPAPDGTTLIYTNTDWEEGGRPIGAYSYEIVDGRGVIRPYSNLSTSHGRNRAGYAITGDSTSIYASYQNETGSCIARMLRSKVKPDIGVASEAPDFCLPDRPSSEGPPFNIRGLAASPQHLFVSLRQDNEVRVYRKDQLTTPVHTVSVPDPRATAYGPNGRLWVIANGQTPYVQEYLVDDATGRLTAGRQLTTPGLVPSALATDPRGLLYVANDAQAAQQIQVFDTTKSDLPEVVSKQLGDAGGVTAFGGAYGPARFDGLTGIAVDNAGNYYVASNGVGASAAESPRFLDIRRFNGASKALEGQAQSYLSTAIVTPDPAAPGVVYSPVQRYELNLDSQVPGTEWSPNRTTLMTDRYRCPDDARVNGIPQNSAIAVRYLGPDRKKFLFVTGQGDVGWMGIYRFTDDGKRTQPSVFLNESKDNGDWPPTKPADRLWSWRDTDGDCQFGGGEYGPAMDLKNVGNWSVSEQGDLWVASFDGQLRRVPFTGMDARDNPIYDKSKIEKMPLPQPFVATEGLVYQSATDTLYLLGRSTNDPTWQTGWRLAKYDNFYERHLAGTGQSPRWIHELPSDLATFCPEDPNKNCRPYTLTVAGDRVYVSNSAAPTRLLYGQIRMYEAATGARRGSLVPGPEVAHRSPWHDMRHAVTAMQLPDGRRYVFAEENFYGKVLLYKGF